MDEDLACLAEAGRPIRADVVSAVADLLRKKLRLPEAPIDPGPSSTSPQTTEIPAVGPSSMAILLPDVGPFYMPISRGESTVARDCPVRPWFVLQQVDPVDRPYTVTEREAVSPF